MPGSNPIIQVRELWKRYGPFEAVRGVNFDVYEGEVFGLLGPNGAGKTTTVEILEGLRPRSEGSVSVMGLDPERDSHRLKERIGVCFQQMNLADKTKVREALDLFGSFYPDPVDRDPLLRRMELWDKRETFYAHLSGGQKQRLALALALLSDPRLCFLDEPTAGLDAQARLNIHELIRELRRDGRTVFLTTHYIEEAQNLCDRVAIMDGGTIIEMGSPREIQERNLNRTTLQITCDRPLPLELPPFEHVADLQLDGEGTILTGRSGRPAKALLELARWIDGLGIELEDINLNRPSLEDVFILLTGRKLRE
jgi:ABC-2 type transport system ATP-binding protein